jgi:hypothetical protein
MNYIIVGNTMINDLMFSKDKVVKEVLGGAVYCVSGLLPWTSNILYVSGVGTDFKHWYGNYFESNNLSYTGLKYCLPKTNYNIVEYAPTGQWHEYSIYSPTYFEDHKKDISIFINDFIQHITLQSRGLYTESRVDEAFWSDIDQLKTSFPQLKIIWEIPTEDAMDKKRQKASLKNIKNCDFFSINLPEAMSLFNVLSEMACIQALLNLNIPVFFRVGEKGAYLIDQNQVLFLESIGAFDALDPTGCGNISTATVLYGLCEHFPLETILAMANVTAYYNTKQYGPKLGYTETERQNIQDLVQKFQSKCVLIDPTV